MKRLVKFETFEPKKVEDRFKGCPTKEMWLPGSLFEALKKKFFESNPDIDSWNTVEEKAYTEMCANYKGGKGKLTIYSICFEPDEDNRDAEPEHDEFIKAIGPVNALIQSALSEPVGNFDIEDIIHCYNKQAYESSEQEVLAKMKQFEVGLENCKSVLQ